MVFDLSVSSSEGLIVKMTTIVKSITPRTTDNINYDCFFTLYLFQLYHDVFDK